MQSVRSRRGSGRPPGLPLWSETDAAGGTAGEGRSRRRSPSLLQGWLESLSGEAFREMGFMEKRRLFEGILEVLGEGEEEPRGRSGDASGEERGAGEGMAAEFVARIREIIREDPFPRIRISAVRVLMALGAPERLGTVVEDYLAGTEDADGLSACTALQFLFTHFGGTCLPGVLERLRERREPPPSALLRLAEGFCRTHFQGLDLRWAMMQLRGASASGSRDGAREAGALRPRGASLDLGPGDWERGGYAARGGPRPGRRRIRRPGEPGRDAPAPWEATWEEGAERTGAVAHGPLGRRFRRVRSRRNLDRRRKEAANVPHHQGRDQDPGSTDPSRDAR